MHRSEGLLGRPSEYGDDGCEVASHCVDCPLATCQFDLPPHERAALKNSARNTLIREGAATGAERSEIAEAACLSIRSVYRVIAEAK